MYDLKDERWIKNINQVKPLNNKVVLTFDDGPSRQLPDILDILKEQNVQAMFFWQSRLVHRERPWKRVLNEGHRFGSHAHKHVNLINLNKDQQFHQIKTSKRILEAITGTEIHHFRPPFGQYNENTMVVLDELQLTPVMWEITSYDWELINNPHKIVTNVAGHIKEGSIILLHELKQTVEILPMLIDELRLSGFEFDIL